MVDAMRYSPANPDPVSVASNIMRYYRVKQGVQGKQLTAIYRDALAVGQKVLADQSDITLQQAMNLVEDARVGSPQARFVPRGMKTSVAARLVRSSTSRAGLVSHGKGRGLVPEGKGRGLVRRAKSRGLLEGAVGYKSQAGCFVSENPNCQYSEMGLQLENGTKLYLSSESQLGARDGLKVRFGIGLSFPLNEK